MQRRLVDRKETKKRNNNAPVVDCEIKPTSSWIGKIAGASSTVILFTAVGVQILSLLIDATVSVVSLLATLHGSVSVSSFSPRDLQLTTTPNSVILTYSRHERS